MSALHQRTVEELSRALEAKEISSQQIVQSCFERISETEHLGCFLHVDETNALRAAQASDDRRAKGEKLSALDGIPVALKDNHMTLDMPTTAASKIIKDLQSPYEATVTRKLREAGAIILGKTNMDEFAMGSSNEHSAYQTVRNPWNTECVPGGSSGGSAAAVAARQVPLSLGTDTGGSIRQPAAMCGVYGLKPTYGRVSRQGIIAFASSLDQVGPFARTPKDLAALLDIIAGYDPLDSTSAQVEAPRYSDELLPKVEGLRIGIPKEYFGEGLQGEVRDRIEQAVDSLKEAGAIVTGVSLPHTKYALSTYYLIATAEVSSNLARYDGIRYGARIEDRDLRKMIARTRSAGFGAEVQRRIVLGTFVLSAGYYDAYYGKAQKVRTLIRKDFENVFDSADVILTPTSPFTAFPLGSKTSDPMSMYLSDICTLAVNLAGVPGLSVPIGFSDAGLPIGAQLIGPWFKEKSLLQVAQYFEENLSISAKSPKL